MSIIVTIPYDPMWRPLVWVKKYCPNYITNRVHKKADNTYDKSKIDYYFSVEAEATMFALKWVQ